MPAGDRTGPEGAGPRTGRGLGYCSGYSTPGYTKGVPRGGAGFGYGRGRGYGFGRGSGRGYYGRGPVNYGPYYPAEQAPPAGAPQPQLSEEDRKNMLKDEAEELRRRIEDIEKELQDLE